MPKQPYHPINCHFYDELELLAIRKKECEIIYQNDTGTPISITSKIIDFKIEEKVEYMVLEGGEKIRLDYLISVDGIKLEGYAC